MSDSKQILGKNAEISRAVKLAMATALLASPAPPAPRMAARPPPRTMPRPSKRWW